MIFRSSSFASFLNLNWWLPFCHYLEIMWENIPSSCWKFKTWICKTWKWRIKMHDMKMQDLKRLPTAECPGASLWSSFPIQLGDMGSVVIEFPLRIEPRTKTFLKFNIHRSPLLTAFDSEFFTCSLKSRGTRRWYQYLSYAPILRLAMTVLFDYRRSKQLSFRCWIEQNLRLRRQ